MGLTGWHQNRGVSGSCSVMRCQRLENAARPAGNKQAKRGQRDRDKMKLKSPHLIGGPLSPMRQFFRPSHHRSTPNTCMSETDGAKPRTANIVEKSGIHSLLLYSALYRRGLTRYRVFPISPRGLPGIMRVSADHQRLASFVNLNVACVVGPFAF